VRQNRVVPTFPVSVEQRLSGMPSEYATSARHLLPRLDALPFSPPYERVLHALLDLAAGDVHELRHLAETAQRDWRDVLMWAEEPDR
jgi:hypothetical protein